MHHLLVDGVGMKCVGLFKGVTLTGIKCSFEVIWDHVLLCGIFPIHGHGRMCEVQCVCPSTYIG